MADVTISYGEYKALLDKIEVLEKEKIEHLKLIDDKVGLIVKNRVAIGDLSLENINKVIGEYLRNGRESREYLHYFVKDVINESVISETYTSISDTAKKIEELSKEIKTLTIQNKELLANKNSQADTISRLEKLEEEIAKLSLKIQSFSVIETAYKKIEKYLEDADQMIEYQKQLEEKIAIFEAKFESVLKTAKSAWFRVRSKILKILND